MCEIVRVNKLVIPISYRTCLQSLDHYSLTFHDRLKLIFLLIQTTCFFLFFKLLCFVLFFVFLYFMLKMVIFFFFDLRLNIFHKKYSVDQIIVSIDQDISHIQLIWGLVESFLEPNGLTCN